MSFFDRLDKHAGLVSGMSDRVGVDWEEAILNNPETAAQFRAAVLKCTGCGDVAECKGWQKSHDTAQEAPEYCLNGGLFEAMKKR